MRETLIEFTKVMSTEAEYYYKCGHDSTNEDDRIKYFAYGEVYTRIHLQLCELLERCES